MELLEVALGTRDETVHTFGWQILTNATCRLEKYVKERELRGLGVIGETDIPGTTTKFGSETKRETLIGWEVDAEIAHCRSNI